MSGPVGARRIIGVDRLDYSKGLPQKFRAFGRFLQKYPENVGTVVLTQIAAPTRESVEAYTDIRKELESYSGSINGTFGGLDWVPINYINRATSRSELPAIFRSSQIAMVTPLRDGMNLVAKEYVAAQDPQDPGVLILSQFAGAAEHMHEALIINPYNIEEMADAIQTALNMPLDERKTRHAALLEGLKKHDVRHWRDDFLGALKKIMARERRLLGSKGNPVGQLAHPVAGLSRGATSGDPITRPKGKAKPLRNSGNARRDMPATESFTGAGSAAAGPPSTTDLPHGNAK
jgi:trehalose 6-phosphate synthase